MPRSATHHAASGPRAWRVSGLALLLCLGLHGSAWAWGHAGHQLIGSLADELLVGSTAAKRVTALLGPGVGNLKTASPWLDCVRDVVFRAPSTYSYEPVAKFRSPACLPFEGPVLKKRMEDFAGRHWHQCPLEAPAADSVAGAGAAASAGAGAGALTVSGTDSALGAESVKAASAGPCHRAYHFTDVAVQHSDYSLQYLGTSRHDIVGTLTAAIAVLRQVPAAPLRARQEALLLIAHLVGDLHQPLHVGAVYLDAADQPQDPDTTPAPTTAPLETRGGNKLEVGDSNLHAMWDEIPWSLKLSNLGTAPGIKRRAALLQAARAVAATAGPAGGWPAAWATDTVMTSHQAFSGLRFTRAGALRSDDWVVSFDNPSSYASTEQTLQRQQLSKAAGRLARLLQAIWP